MTGKSKRIQLFMDKDTGRNAGKELEGVDHFISDTLSTRSVIFPFSWICKNVSLIGPIHSTGQHIFTAIF